MAIKDPTLRIPNLPIGPIVDKNLNPTQNEGLFRQSLVDLLQTYLGPEGVVSPEQSPTNVQTILNGVNEAGQYTMLPGTIIYQKDDSDYTKDKLIIAFRNSNTVGAQPKLYYVNVTAL